MSNYKIIGKSKKVKCPKCGNKDGNEIKGKYECELWRYRCQKCKWGWTQEYSIEKIKKTEIIMKNGRIKRYEI